MKLHGIAVLKSINFFLLVGIFSLYYLGAYYSPLTSSAEDTVFRLLLGFSSLVVIGKHFSLRFRVKISPYVALIGVFFLYILLNSIFVSSDLKPVRRALLLLLLFFLIAHVEISRNAWVFGFRVLAFFSAAMALFSLINTYRLGLFPMSYRSLGLEGSGLSGVADFGNTIVAGMHYAIAFAVTAFLYFTDKRNGRVLLWSLLLAILSVYIVLTFARTAWVACAIVFMVLGGMLYRKTHWRRYLPPLLVLLILLYVFFSYYAGYEFSGRGLTARDEIWLSTWNSSTASVKTFLFGHGAAKALEAKALSTGQVVYNTHSVYLEALYRYGAVGLALLLVIMLGALNILYKTIKHHEYGELAVFWLATLVSGSIVMIVELNGLITTPNLLWHWLWMPVAFALFCQVNLNKGTS